MKTFVCNEIEEWDLKGKYVDSLEKLLLHRQSQGTYSRYRLNQVDDNPLLLPSKKPKKHGIILILSRSYGIFTGKMTRDYITQPRKVIFPAKITILLSCIYSII